MVEHIMRPEEGLWASVWKPEECKGTSTGTSSDKVLRSPLDDATDVILATGIPLS